MTKTLADWLSYLDSLHPKTIALGLDRVDAVKHRLNLAPDFPVIVVGGTNGKGSVCAMLEAMLHAAGYRVACYSSPHLLHYNERVRIAKRPVSDADLCHSFEQIEKIRDDIPLTYFEFGTLAAMQLFIKHEVEVAILEVGLGGRLDAVNVFDADCVVLTNVDIDHTDYLGETREQIAFEKAGIFRAGCVAICADRDVPQAVTEGAEKTGAQLWRIGHEFSVVSHQGQWDFCSLAGARLALPYPALRGAFQLNNASAALAVLGALKDKLPVSMTAVRRGLNEVRLAGRFQFVAGKPQLILDVAHNPHAARNLARNLAALPPCPHRYAVFSMLADKDIAGVVAALSPYIDTWLVAGLSATRSVTVEALSRLVAQTVGNDKVIPFSDTAQALAYAYNVADENDRIITFGSFYTVAEVMDARGIRVLQDAV
ncbi:MAG: bifunctional tetrahydrofolate synthase/dihydrofolate synthase [Gallionella sp.]